MDHKITMEEAKSYHKEFIKVKQKIRNSNCKKKNSSLEEFNWFINSCVEWLTTGSGRVFACLVAKTKGIGYYSDHFEIVPNYIIEYWKN